MAIPTVVKELSEILTDKSAVLPQDWGMKVIVNDDNLGYLAFHKQNREAIVVDPMREDWETLIRLCADLKGYRFVAVIDTHTHADHVSSAARLAEHLGVPLIQHLLSPSQRIHIRISRDTQIPTASGPLRFLTTPGHTPDSLTPIWGPFVFTGDTILYGDSGRDDLPGGDPAAHYESLVKIKGQVRPEQIMLANHDGMGGRASTWQTQLRENSALTQDRETFVREAGSYVGPSPKHLKESLFENFK